MKEFAITSRSDLQRKSRGVARKTLAHLAWREGGLPMTVIAQWLGVSGSAVSKMIRTSRDLETSDRTYRQVMESLRNTLENP